MNFPFSWFKYSIGLTQHSTAKHRTAQHSASTDAINSIIFMIFNDHFLSNDVNTNIYITFHMMYRVASEQTCSNITNWKIKSWTTTSANHHRLNFKQIKTTSNRYTQSPFCWFSTQIAFSLVSFEFEKSRLLRLPLIHRNTSIHVFCCSSLSIKKWRSPKRPPTWPFYWVYSRHRKIWRIAHLPHSIYVFIYYIVNR